MWGFLGRGRRGACAPRAVVAVVAVVEMVAVVVLTAGCSSKVPAPVSHATERVIRTNRGADVADGFRGDVHPEIATDLNLDVSAACSFLGTGRGFDAGYFPPQFRQPFETFRVAHPARSYAARDLSAFLPVQFTAAAGQTWEIDTARLVPFLRQFHAGASWQLGAPGRRYGPNGAFATLRGISDSHYEILARVHAEFQLDRGVFVSPAYFEGNLWLNRATGNVDYFRLAVPTDLSLNTTLTRMLDREALIDIIHVEQFELVAGQPPDPAELTWSSQIETSAAREKLKRQFYKFLEINWVKPELAAEEAKRRQKPIMALVLWGDLDDQSC